MPNPVLLTALRGVFRAVHACDRRRPVFDPAAVQRILVVNTTAIGDTLLSTPAIRQLRRRFPQAHIAALVSAAAAEVLQHNPHLDAFIPHPGRVNLAYLRHLPRLLRQVRQQFDLVVILHANDPDIVPLVYLSGAPHRYGWAESRLAFLLTMPVPTRRTELHGLTEKIRNLRVLGIDSDDETMELVLTEEERRAARAFCTTAGVSGPYVCLHPYGNRHSRWWGGPAEWTELAEHLRAAHGLPLVLVGNAHPAAADGVRSSVGQLSLRVTAALIGGARAMISTDSGPLHIAQALAVPTLGLFGASLPEITGPRRAEAQVLRDAVDCAPCNVNRCDDHRCMRQLTPARVAAALAHLLRQTESR